MKVRNILSGSLWILLILTSGILNADTFTVNNTNDTGPGSLREAITLANNTAGLDTIVFNIPNTGPHTISLLSQLPWLTDPSGVLIDGFSQPGSTPGTNPPSTAVIMIEVDGFNAGGAHGLWVLSPCNTIRGLSITNFYGDGIRIQGTEGAGTHNNLIYCNFVGLVPAGQDPGGNGRDTLNIWAGINIVVSPDPVPRFAFSNIVEGNLSSCNHAEGVSISSCPPGDVYDNVIRSNYLGTDITGTLDRGNRHTGIYIGEAAHDNVVEENIISGNECEGISMVGYPRDTLETYGNHILNNIIGLDVNHQPLKNNREGINIGEYYGTRYQGGYALDNRIGPGNIIAENGISGISIWEHPNNTWNADGNTITENSIFENSALGIDLCNDGITQNDSADLDSGPNQGLNFPVITNAVHNFGQTTVSGNIVVDTDPTLAVVEVFKAMSDPSEYGEGETYLGSTSPDADGNWSIIVTGINPGEAVTVTTTDMNSNTSEFSANFDVIETEIDAEEVATEKPAAYAMSQNYPNPFNPTTKIRFSLPNPGHVILEIYNIFGQHVETLINEERAAGKYDVQWNAEGITSGIYLCRLEAGHFVEMKKLILQR